MAVQDYLKGLWELISKNHRGVITVAVVFIVIIYLQACQSTTKSIIDPNMRVTRVGLQIELETIQSKYKEANADLDQQDAIKKMIVENAILIASGGAVNPVGILSGVAAIYGIASAGSSVVKKVRKSTNKTTTETA